MLNPCRVQKKFDAFCSISLLPIFLNHEGENKANDDQLEEQEPTKKIVNDNKDNGMEIDKTASVIGGSAVGESSSSSKIIPQERVKKATQQRDRLNELSAETLTLINQTWKDDLASGRLLVSLSESFGESIFPFMAMPEMSIFL